jgi:hypothetical protein
VKPAANRPPDEPTGQEAAGSRGRPAKDRTGRIRRAVGTADFPVLAVSAFVIAAAWSGVGYAVGRWPGMVVGAVLGLAASAALAVLVGRLRV